MEHNWYETTVTTLMPHRIISVIDWVSDFPVPIRFVEGECGLARGPHLCLMVNVPPPQCRTHLL